MVLKLDPRFLLVWRSPNSLQLGVSTPVAVMSEVSVAAERMLAALSVGVTRPGLSMIGRDAGACEADVESLLASIRGALVDEKPEAARSRVVVVGTGLTAERIAEGLAADGVVVRTASAAAAAENEPCDIAVAIGHFVLAPELHGMWLRRDIPHLPVLYSDNTVSIGPVIEPGSGPCLFCIQNHRTDADPAWPAIACQLLGRRSAVESPLVSGEVAMLVGRLVQARLRPGARPATVHYSTILEPLSGAVSCQPWVPHPECLCIGAGSPAVENTAAENTAADNTPVDNATADGTGVRGLSAAVH